MKYQSKFTHPIIKETSAMLEVEVYGYKKNSLSLNWFYAGKLDDDNNLITVTHRSGLINKIKCTDKNFNYNAAKEWLESQEISHGSRLVPDYTWYDLSEIIHRKDFTPKQLGGYLSTLPNYCHQQFISMAKDILSPDDYQEFAENLPRDRQYTDTEIFEIADQAMSDLGF